MNKIVKNETKRSAVNTPYITPGADSLNLLSRDHFHVILNNQAKIFFLIPFQY